MNSPLDISISIYIKLQENSPQKSYIIDTGMEGDHKDRISVFLQDDQLVFGVTDRTGQEHVALVTCTELNEKFNMVTFELANIDNRSNLYIFKNTELVSYNKDLFELIFTNNPYQSNYFIGADRSGNNPSNFEIAEQVIYGKVLVKEEKEKLFNHLTEKHGNSPKFLMQFKNGAFLYRDRESNNLIQPNPRFQPKYKSSNFND